VVNTVDFKPWATGGGADVIDQATFLALFAPGGIGLNGFATGTAISGQLNKVWRQSSFVAAALAGAVSATLGQDVLDNGNLPALTAQIVAAVQALITTNVATYQTGDTLWRPTAQVRGGFVRMNALSIGDAASAASERANADTLNLYTFLWNSFGQSLCPVTGGRGASALADFNAHKPIQLLDMRGTVPFGLDGMGNSLSGRITQGTPDIAGTGGGAEFHAIGQANLPNVSIALSGSGSGTISGTALNAGTHQHNLGRSIWSPDTPGDQPQLDESGGSRRLNFWTNPLTQFAGNHTHVVTGSASVSISGATAGLGSGVALYTMPAYMLGAWYIKL
jgi:hypothetical protein